MKLLKISLVLPLFLLVITPAIAFGRPFSNNRDFEGGRNDEATHTGMMRSCEARLSGITMRMKMLTRLSNIMEEKFTDIATRVENYYTDKVVPSGKTVSNYDSLVSDINAKKDAVTAALNAAQTDVNGFNCSSTDPKADLTKFRQDMQTVKSALKDYRTSIKNLIVAVKGVVGEDNKDNKKGDENETGTPTPTPTLTPTPTSI